MKNNPVYQYVTDRITAYIEQNQDLPWNSPWFSRYMHNKACNLITRKPYRGVNKLLLFIGGYESPYFLTAKQAADLGGKVRKGEKAHIVTYYSVTHYTEDAAGKRRYLQEWEAAECIMRGIPVTKSFALRYYNVFNLQQCENIPAEKIPLNPEFRLSEIPPHELAEGIAADYLEREKIPLKFEGNRAFYRMGEDSITLPPREQFESVSGYYSVLFHEIAHSTGAETRLNRPMTGYDESRELYAAEELIAEISAAFLLAECGICEENDVKRSAGYVKGWLKALKDDPKLITIAAGSAEKAAEFILATEPAEETAEV